MPRCGAAGGCWAETPVTETTADRTRAEARCLMLVLLMSGERPMVQRKGQVGADIAALANRSPRRGVLTPRHANGKGAHCRRPVWIGLRTAPLVHALEHVGRARGYRPRDSRRA